jgi:RNA polymerase sigma-70 factor (ECF subfamily)
MPEAAFFAWVTRLVRSHRLPLIHLARREGLLTEDAFDAVQEAFHSFLLLPQARALVESEDDSRNLLAALTRNLARNRRRRHELVREHVQLVPDLRDEGDNAEELLAQAQDRAVLLGCVNLLGRVQRSVVTLRMLEGREGKSVARELKLKPGHVAVLLHRAKSELRECVTSAKVAAQRLRAIYLRPGSSSASAP